MSDQSDSLPDTAQARRDVYRQPPLSKPFRLRAACNSCHFAKVKCTGGKPSCHRCLSGNLECTYSISMVGKVQGSRRRSKRSFDESTDSGGDQGASHERTFESRDQPASSTAASTHFTTPPPSVPARSPVPSHAESGLIPPSSLHLQLQLQQPELDWPSPFSLNDSSLFASGDDFLHPLTNDWPCDQPQQHPCPQLKEASATPRLNLLDDKSTSSHGFQRAESTTCVSEARSLGTTAARTRQGECTRLLTCVGVLDQLWRRQCGTLTRPDVIMAVNKTAIGTLTEFLSELDYCDNRDAGLMLCALAMQAVTDLYGQVFDSSMQPARDSSALPAFGFGSFEIDTSSQRKLFNQIMLKEIELTLKLWKRIWATMYSQSLGGQSSRGICEDSFLKIRNKLRKMMSDIDL